MNLRLSAAGRIALSPLLWASLALFLPPHTGRADERITLAEAERLALEHDPAVRTHEARAAALDEAAVADGQLPDPRLRTGLYNLPLDDFSLASQPTTQWRLGIQQAFPRGDSLKYKAGRTRARAEAERAQAALSAAQARRGVREAFLEILYQQGAHRIVVENRALFAALVNITQAHYGAGRSDQQDVLRAELELSRLDDRLDRIRNAEESARADLQRWIGAAASRPLAPGLPGLPAPPAETELRRALERHPEITRRSAVIQARQQAVDLAREQYKPGWGLGVEYRKRFGHDPGGDARTDMAAVMLTLDLPLFTEKRQDRRLAASQKEADAAFLERADTYRRMRRLLAREYANWRRLGDRAARYDSELVDAAHQNAEAALNAYQSGTLEFTNLMRARITELDVQLQALRVGVDRLKAQARLLYLAAGAREDGR